MKGKSMTQTKRRAIWEHAIFSSGGYPDLQKASGLKVLKKTVERQRSLQKSEGALAKQVQGDLTTGSSRSSSSSECYRKKPPARLNPIGCKKSRASRRIYYESDDDS